MDGGLRGRHRLLPRWLYRMSIVLYSTALTLPALANICLLALCQQLCYAHDSLCVLAQ